MIVEAPLVFGWCGVVGVVGDLAVKPVLVEPVDVGHGGELDVLEAPPRALSIDEFPFVETIERFDEGIDASIDRKSVSGCLVELGCGGFGEEVVELSGDVSFQASDDVFLGEALGGSSFHVGDGGWVPAHADDDDPVRGRRWLCRVS